MDARPPQQAPEGIQERGDIRSDIKLEFIVFILNHLLEIAADERLVRLYDSPEAMTAELMNFFFYGILPRE